MEPKIIFLGVAGDYYVVGKQARCSGGIIVQFGDFQLHLDPGPGALLRDKMCMVNPRENTAILVSHSHISHCSEVNALISATTANGLDKTAVLICSKSLTQGLAGQAPYLTDFHKNSVEKVIAVEKGNQIGINKIEIDVLEARHSDPTAVGYKMVTPGLSIVYSGDTEYFEDMKNQYKGANILILNVQEPFGKKSEGRLSADDAVKIFSEVKPKLGIITHFGAKMVVFDPMSAARDIQRQTGVQIVAAKDGLVVDPVSCSAK
jgi:ribonuclease BN (tRNA processing enzyme)